jgi:squalene-hopene/tetraprenyl-beta-curcumene cyclase
MSCAQRAAATSGGRALQLEDNTMNQRRLAGALIAAGLGLGALVFDVPAPRPAQAQDAVDAGTPAPNSPDEPMAAELSLARSAQFLDAIALDWTRKRQCGTCHTNYAYLIARPALGASGSPAMDEIRSFFEGRIAHWDDTTKGAKPRWDTEVVATAVTLALNDAATTGTLHPLTRRALDRMWTLQKPGGAWDWIKCDWPPLEHDDYYGAVFAAVGVGHAPEGYARSESAQPGLARLRGYLHENRPPDLHHATYLLWAAQKLDGLMMADAQAQAIARLRDRQRGDGGWSLPSLGDWKRRDGTPNDPDAPSDGYATGLVVYVLRQAGVPATDPAIARGVDWLKTHQRASGRWFTRSLNTDRFHYITGAGTGFAVLALRACEQP